VMPPRCRLTYRPVFCSPIGPVCTLPAIPAKLTAPRFSITETSCRAGSLNATPVGLTTPPKWAILLGLR